MDVDDLDRAGFFKKLRDNGWTKEAEALEEVTPEDEAAFHEWLDIPENLAKWNDAIVRRGGTVIASNDIKPGGLREGGLRRKVDLNDPNLYVDGSGLGHLMLKLGEKGFGTEDFHLPKDPGPIGGDMPEWEGSPSYRNVWRSLDWMHTTYHKTDRVRGLDAICGDAKIAMKEAHPIVVPPEQVEVLPQLDLMEASEYLNAANLPFEPLFLDTASGTGPETFTKLTEAGVDHEEIGESVPGMTGAVIFDNPYDNGRGTVPFGAAMIPVETNDLDYQGFLVADAGGNGLPSHAPLALLINNDDFATRRTWRGVAVKVDIDSGAQPLERLWKESLPETQHIEQLIIGGEVFDGPESLLILLNTPDVFAYRHIVEADAISGIKGWGMMATVQYRAIASILMLLESHNVEVRQTEVSRQVRRNAERKGHPIAKTVYIRHRQAAPGVTSRNGGEPARYSHSFEVIGHFKHVQKGKHVWCKTCRGEGKLLGPSLPNGRQDEATCDKCDGLGLDRAKITPCARRDQDGNLTCPKGCRKEWVPSFAKGDGPLVMKLRKQT